MLLIDPRPPWVNPLCLVDGVEKFSSLGAMLGPDFPIHQHLEVRSFGWHTAPSYQLGRQQRIEGFKTLDKVIKNHSITNELHFEVLPFQMQNLKHACKKTDSLFVCWKAFKKIQSQRSANFCKYRLSTEHIFQNLRELYETLDTTGTFPRELQWTSRCWRQGICRLPYPHHWSLGKTSNIQCGHQWREDFIVQKVFWGVD